SASAGPLGGAPAASGLCAAAGVINKVATTPARRGAAERLSSTLSASRSVDPRADRIAARQRRRRYAGRQMETRPWHAVCNLSPFVRRETQHETVLDVVRGRARARRIRLRGRTAAGAAAAGSARAERDAAVGGGHREVRGHLHRSARDRAE